MSRTGFAVLSLGVLLSLLLLASAGSLAHAGDTFAALLTPVLIILAGTAIGVVVALRARATHLSGLWGFLAMILTVEALALMVTILVDDALPDPLRAVLGMPALWLLVSFIGFLLWVPNWAGPRALDIGLSVVAALAAIIVIATGYTMLHGPEADASVVERAIADMVAAVPSVDWIGVGVFVTALAGVMAGRLLPEAQ
jgi:hypothetical protein